MAPHAGADVVQVGSERWDPSHRFETSWLISPFALFWCRAVMSLYAFTLLFFKAGWGCRAQLNEGYTFRCEESGDDFSYFTNLTYWGIAFYHLFAAIHTFSYARSGSAFLDRWPRPLQALHSMLYTTVTTYPFLVTAVFWGLLAKPTAVATPYHAWVNISQHALNSVYALFEIIVPRTAPQPWLHLPWLIVILALYLALAYVTRATKGFYTYAFLDPARIGSLVAAYVFGIAVAIIVVFLLVRGLICVRRRLTEDKLGFSRKRGAGGPMATPEEMGEGRYRLTTSSSNTPPVEK